MVWFLLGGKDVGKSTFLNALLDTEVSGEPADSAEGTRQFVAYVHESARRDLETRLGGLPIQLRLHTHTSESHQRLCLIDSPDFDSRFERHASQVGEVLQAGAADGAVLLASPEKYKNLTYWKVFGELSRTLSPRHILFVLTKADELGGYLEQVRADFAHTVSQRLPDWGEAAAADPSLPPTARVFLIDSPGRGLDFPALESRLLQRLTRSDVRQAQEENLRHALLNGIDRLREHYRLEEVRSSLGEATRPERAEAVFQEHFPEAFAHTVAARVAASREVRTLLRERAHLHAGATLAGMPALQAALQGLADLNPFRPRARDADTRGQDLACEMERLTRWGEEDLDERARASREELLAELRLEHPGALDPYRREQPRLRDALARRLEDLLALPLSRTLDLKLRLLLNLPVYLYFLFFLVLLLSPVLLVVRAWLLPRVPDPGALFTLDLVKVSVIGFAGYYTMAALFVVRKQRDRIRGEMGLLSQRFVSEMELLIRAELARPLSRFGAEFNRLLERLDRLGLP